MTLSRTALSEWAWAGGPSRRLLLSVLATLLVILVPAAVGSPTPLTLVALFLGWDLGAWFMDKVYVDRLSRKQPVAQ